MGVVYEATQVSLARPVALKVIAPELAGRREFRDRFVRESRLAASLDHPNVIPVYAAGEENDVLYIAMRRVDGVDLRALIAREGALDPARVAHIAAQVASALEAAHECGLVHRDVKPGNILVSPRGGGEHVYLTDFGLTKRTASDSGLTASGEWVGTLDYVAPEQIRGDSVDGRADVYSLGCVVYEALTGRVPFPRENDLAKLWAHISDAPPLASDTAPDVPPELAAAARRAMSKDPHDRFTNAGDLGAAAIAAVAGAPTRPHASAPGRGATSTATGRPSTLAPSGTRSRRRAVALIGAGGVLAALGVVAVLALSSGGDEADGAREPPAGVVKGPPVRVGDSPTAVAAGGGSLWVANTGAETVSRVDPRSARTVGAPIAVGEDPRAIAVGAGFVWVANFGDRTVSRIDPHSGRTVGEPIAVGGAPTDIVVGHGFAFVATERDRVVRLNARTGAVAGAPIRVRAGGPLALSGNFLWVADRMDGTMRSVQTSNGVVAGGPIVVGREPADLVAGPDGIWVSLAGDGVVKRIVSTANGPSLRTVRTGGRPEFMVLRRHDLWVTDRDSESVLRIDAASAARRGGAVRVPEDPAGIAVAAGRVWVASAVTDRLTPVEPR
jgi:DNA-binding beta-propeller fold protein YncE